MDFASPPTPGRSRPNAYSSSRPAAPDLALAAIGLLGRSPVNGFTHVGFDLSRGMKVNDFAPDL